MTGILFSGGLESTSLIQYFLDRGNHNLVLFYVKNGFPWEEAELKHAQQIAEKCYKLPFIAIECPIVANKSDFSEKKISNSKENTIPLRNLTLVTNVANYILFHSIPIKKLALGIQNIITYPDNSKEYFKKIELLINVFDDKRLKIELPFYKKTKIEIINKYWNKIPLQSIFSCVSPNEEGEMCGKCYKCKNLKLVLDYLGRPEIELTFAK